MPDTREAEIIEAREGVSEALRHLVQLTTQSEGPVIVSDFIAGVEIVLPNTNAQAVRIEWSNTMTPWKGYGMSEASMTIAQRIFT